MRPAGRALTDRERAVLDLLLAADFKGAATLRAQARTATVARECACGCATVDLRVDRDETAAAPVERAVPVEGRACSGSNPWRAVHLYVDGGWLRRLELEWDADSPVREFPAPADIAVVPR